MLTLNDKQEPALTLFNAAKLPRAVVSGDASDQSGSGDVILHGAAGGLELYDDRPRSAPRDAASPDVPAPK